MIEGFGDMDMLRESLAAGERAIGPCYTVQSASEVAGLTLNNFRRHINDGDVLVLVRGQDRVCPAFQFDDGGALLPGLREVLAALQVEPFTPYGCALWLVARGGILGERSAVELLRAGDLQPVLAAARLNAAWRAEEADDEE